MEQSIKSLTTTITKCGIEILDRFITVEMIIIVGLLVLGIISPEERQSVISGLLGFLTKTVLDTTRGK